MAGIVETILLNIQASVSGAAGIAGLTGGISGLTNKLLGLNSGLQIVQQVTQSISSMVSQMDAYAQKADGAAVAARSWQIVLERFNIDGAQAGQVIADLSAKTGASEMSLKGAAAQYIKMGGTLEDFSKVALAASSSWYDLTVKSISLDDAINNVSTGVASGRSELLESSGVMLNASQAWKRYADEVGKGVDELSDAEKAHAYAIGVYKEEQIGIETLADKQTELSRARNAETQASDRLAEAIGRNLLPLQVKLTQASAEVQRALTQMFDAYQQGGDALKVLTDKYPALGRVLSQLKPVADEMKRGLLDAWRGITDFAERVLLPAFEDIRPVVERVWKYIPPLIASAGQLIGQTFRLIADLWVNVLKPVWDELAPVVEYAVTGALKFLQGGFDFISGIFTSIRALIAGDWRGAWETFRETVSTAWEKVNTVLQGLGQSIRAALDRLIDAAKEKGRNFGLNLRDSIVAGVSGLAEQLTDKMTEAINRMTEKLPQWFKDRFGITAVVETLEGNADAAGARAAAARAGIAGRAPTVDPSTLNDFEASVYSAALDQRADQKADSLVDYCARWVRDTLGDAAPEMRKAINALFLNNGGPNGSTARTAYANFQKAGLARDYKTFADLKPGDTVFYVDGGQNHTGVYIGNGMVRGNNRVTYQENGGRFGPGGITSGVALDSGKVNPVGDVQINRLGKVTGYVAAQELLAYLTGRVPVTGTPKAGTPANVPTVKPPTPADTTDQGGPFTAAQYAEAMKRLKAVDAAQKALQAKPGDVGLANTLTAAQAASEKFSKSSLAAADALKAAQTAMGGTKKAADAYIATLADFKQYGTDALLLIKEQERVNVSGTAAEREAVRGRVLNLQKAGEAQDAVLTAERAAYQSRQQLREKDKQDEAARAQLMAQIARDAAAGREADARAGLETLKRQQQAKLDLVEGDAAAQAKIIQSTGPQILAAEALIARRVRELAVKSANETAAERLKVEGANAAEIEKARRAAVASAYRDEKNAGEVARLAGLRQLKTAQDDVNQSLKDGVEAGNAALDSLDSLTLGGRDLITTAQKLPDTRAQFDTLFARIVALRGELAEPGVVDAWTQSIQDMGKAGQLSALQVQTLLNIVKDLSAARDTQKGDNLQGRGVLRQAAADDASQGTLAAGEVERLLSAMIGMDPQELGSILADLVAKGFGESDLAKLIRSQIVTMNFDDLAQMVMDANGPRFQTDDELRGIGQPAQNATEAYLNLESVIQDIARFSLPELDALVAQTGLGADEAERLYAAWAAVYGEFEKGTGGTDATTGPGKGLLNNARPDDASQGTLAPGEADRLLEAMVGMDPKELGGILADLVARGFGESDLGRLIRGYIQSSAEAINASLREFGGVASGVGQTDADGVTTPGEDVYLTDDQVRGIGQRSEAAQDAFLNLEEVTERAMSLTRDELAATLASLGLLPEQIEQITRAWEDLHGTVEGANLAALDEQLAPIAVNLQGVFDRLKSGASTAGEARLAFEGIRAQLEGIGGPAAQNLIGVIDEAVRGFDSLGEVSADVTGALAKLRKEAELPYDGLIRKLQQMRTEPGAAVAEIDALIASLQKLNGVAAKDRGIEEMTAKINKFADYARKSIPLVTSAFQALGGASEEVAAGWGDSLSRMVDDVVNFATAIAKGDYVGAAIQALTTIFTFFARKAEEARAELKKTMDYSKQFRFDNGNGYDTRKTTSTTTGFLWWQKTIVTEEIDEIGKALALSFEGAVVNGVGSGLAEAVAKNDSSILEKSILTGMKNAALQGLTEAFLGSASVVAVMGPLIQKLIAAFKSGNTENIRAAVAEFREGVRGMRSEMDGLVEAGRIVTEELGGAGESFASSFGDSIRAGVRAILGGQSPLQALYDDVRTRIGDAVVNGFYVQAALDKLQPFLDAVKAKLDAGLDPTQAIAQIGMQLPGLSAQLQLELGPLVAALNTYLPNALNANTAALNGNTAALRESKFESTTVVSYADVGRNDTRLRYGLAGL